LASQLRPARFGVGILLQATQGFSVELKVNLAQTLLGGRARQNFWPLSSICALSSSKGWRHTANIASSSVITVGMSSTGRVLIVAHAGRNENVRIVSARKTTKHERKHYEEKN
jgi:hypothetical protein